jgi:hypothetical protein
VSGPRVTSGTDSQQDYKTPGDFMGAVTERWGPICFDLAAHAGNAQHARYFAPAEFVKIGTMEEITSGPVTAASVTQLFTDAKKTKPKLHSKSKQPLYERRIINVDPNAYALDAFKHPWAPLSKGSSTPDGKPGLLWLNCEFDDIDPWAERCRQEAEQGARILLLTPATLTKWFVDHIAGIADTILLLGRLCFDGKHPYPKDCMLSYFSPPGPRGSALLRPGAEIEIWDWRNQKTLCDGTWVRKS